MSKNFSEANTPSGTVHISERDFNATDNPITRYLNTPELMLKKRSKHVYGCTLRHYFDTIEADMNTYFDNGRNYEADIAQYIERRLEKKKASSSIRSDLSVIKCFLGEYDIELSPKFIRRMGKRIGSGARITQDRIMTKQELRDTLQFGDVRMRAIILVETSSGMRGGETLKLKWKDIDFTVNPVQVNIPSEITKTHTARVTFISNEARDALLMWKKTRYKWKQMHDRSYFTKIPYDAGMIFQMHLCNVGTTWRKMLAKAGLGEYCPKTGRIQRHMHMNRAFFRTNLGKAVPVDIVEEMMGHSGYLTASYRRHRPEELAKEYLKGVHELTIYSNTPNREGDAGLREEFDMLKAQMKQLLTRLNNADGESDDDDITGDEIEKALKSLK